MTDPVTPTATSPDKPKRARKGKPKPPAAPKPPAKERKKPDTIHAWIRAQGSAHVEAARILGKQFVRELREERESAEAHHDAMMRVEGLKFELAEAERKMTLLSAQTGQPSVDRLNALAISIAKARAGSLNAEASPVKPTT